MPISAQFYQEYLERKQKARQFYSANKTHPIYFYINIVYQKRPDSYESYEKFDFDIWEGLEYA